MFHLNPFSLRSCNSYSSISSSMCIAPLVSSTSSSTHAESFCLIPSVIPEAFLTTCLLDNLCGHSVFRISFYSFYISPICQLNILSFNSSSSSRIIYSSLSFSNSSSNRSSNNSNSSSSMSSKPCYFQLHIQNCS